MQIQLSSRAEDELIDIIISSKEKFGTNAAKATDLKLRTAIRQLKMYPQLGKLDDELGDGTRILVSGAFRIVYSIVADVVHISRVVSPRQDV